MATLKGRAALLALLAAVLAGCTAQRTPDGDLAAPRTRDELKTLMADVRAFERRIGFKDTKNFLTFADGKAGYPHCGSVSRYYLPYSYEDPAVQWAEVESEEECRALGEALDIAYGETEAVGEQESPVTTSMLAAPIDRLLYLVIHEDCHDQYDLPQGIEEPVCNLIAYRAMTRYAAERYSAAPKEREAVERYVKEGARHSHLTIAWYHRLAALYGSHGQGAISAPALLAERARLFSEAERELDWPEGTMNNVWFANTMTYSRHYPLIERVHDALGRDLERTVAFFKRVDAAKPRAAAVVKKLRLADDASVEFVRAYEAEVVATIERALDEERKARAGR